MGLLSLALVLLGVAFAADPTQAAERTFMFSAADVVQMIDDFNASVLSRSDLGGATKLRQGSVSFAGKRCPSLALDAERRATRLRVLDGPEGAAAFASRRPNKKLAAALEAMGAATWIPPGKGLTHRFAWGSEPLSIGTTGFATAGFASGDSKDGITQAATSDTAASFLVSVDFATPASADPAELVVAVTTELPRTSQTGKPKRTECYLVTSAHATDLQALEDLLAATEIPEPSATELRGLLTEADYWVAKGRLKRAVLVTKRFGLRVATLSPSDVPADAAEALVTRTLAVVEMLGF